MKKTAAGVNVTPATVMGLPAAYRAVRLKARTMATLPIGVYERLEDGSRRPAPKHPLHYILTVRPNRWMTPFGFKEMLAGHVELRGNAYAEIIADGRGRVTDLIPRHPDRITVHYGVLAQGFEETIWYEYQPKTGGKKVILWDEMLHLRGFSQDGLVGLNPVEIAREAFGLAIGNQDYAAKIIGNDATPNGLLKTPKKMDKPIKKAFRESWVEQHGAGANRATPAILDDGMEWVAMGFKPVDAQFLEQRKFDITEIARIFDLPPHKIMDLDRSTNNNIEHQGIEYVMDTILPLAVNWEETIERDLFLPSDLGRFYVECNVEGLMRGDSAARAAFYTALFNVGALRPNDIRRKENMDPLEGGDEAFVQLNMVPLKQAAQLLALPSGQAAPADDPNSARAIALRKRIARAHEPMFVDAVGRALSRELISARRALDKAQKERSLGPFDQWVGEFYGEYEAIVARALDPVMQTAGAAIAAGILNSCRQQPDAIQGLPEFLANAARAAARVHVVTSSSEIRRVIKETDPDTRAAALTALLDGWEASRAAADGVKESNQLARQVGDFIHRTLGLPQIEEPQPEAA
jgi:HK97 family phage portal protein